MKYLLAFALIAVATALPEPLRLPEPVAPLVVPQEVMDAVAFKVNVVDALESSAALVADAPVESDHVAVNIVEEAVNVDAPKTFAVNVVEEVVNVDAPQPAVAPETQADFAVNYVEAVNAEAPVDVNNDASDYAVHFVDEAVNVDAPEATVVEAESPLQIKIVDMPLPESVVMPLTIPTINNVFVDAPVESNDDLAVKFVDVADDVDQEKLSFRPQKLYPNPMWR